MGKQIRNVNVLIRSEVKYKTPFPMQKSVNCRNLVICNKINIILTCSHFWKNTSCFGKKESNKKQRCSISRFCDFIVLDDI